MILLLCLSLGACTTAPAATEENTEEETTALQQDDKIEVARQKVVVGVRKVANKIDTFFAGERIIEESRGNYLRLNLLTRYLDTGQIDFNQNLHAKLVFPNTQKRWNLVIETDTDSDIEGDEFVNDPIGAPGESNYSVGLRYIAREYGDWRLMFDAGMLFVTPVDLFVRGRVRRHTKHNVWATRLAQSLTAYSSERQIATTQIDFDRLLRDDRLFRYSVEINLSNVDAATSWVQSASIYALGSKQGWKQSASIFQRLDSRQAMQYQAGIIGVSTSSIRDYFVNVRYRRQLDRKWLFFEVTPEYNWLESNNYDPHFAVLFKIEAVFSDD